MFIEFSAKDLAAGFSLVKEVVPANPHHPSIGTFLTKVDKKGWMTVTGTNLGNTMIWRTQLQRYKPGAACLALASGAKAFVDFLGNLVGTVQIRVDDWDSADAPVAYIRCGDFQTKLRCLSYEDFPIDHLIDEGGQSFDFQDADFVDLVSTKYAASSDELKQVLIGVNFQIEPEGRVATAATDGHRLAVREHTLSVAPENISRLDYTIPAKIITLAEKLLKSQRKHITLTFGKAAEGEMSALKFPRYEFRCGKFMLCGSPIEGQFPNYRNLIPAAENMKFKWQVDKTMLETALARVYHVAAQGNGIIKFAGYADGLAVIGTSEAGGTAKQFLPATLTENLPEETDDEKPEADAPDQAEADAPDEAEAPPKEKMVFCLKYSYLKQAINSLKTDGKDPKEIAIYINGGTSPILICADGVEGTGLVMPVQVRDDDNSDLEDLPPLDEDDSIIERNEDDEEFDTDPDEESDDLDEDEPEQEEPDEEPEQDIEISESDGTQLGILDQTPATDEAEAEAIASPEPEPQPEQPAAKPKRQYKSRKKAATV